MNQEIKETQIKSEKPNSFRSQCLYRQQLFGNTTRSQIGKCVAKISALII
jgi:hypothetical protein